MYALFVNFDLLKKTLHSLCTLNHKKYPTFPCSELQEAQEFILCNRTISLYEQTIFWVPTSKSTKFPIVQQSLLHINGSIPLQVEPNVVENQSYMGTTFEDYGYGSKIRSTATPLREQKPFENHIHLSLTLCLSRFSFPQ